MRKGNPRNRTYGRYAGLFVLLALQACRTMAPPAAVDPPPAHKGEVSYALLTASSANQYQLKRNEHAYGAQPLEHDPPAYPSSLVGAGLAPTTVQVKAIIDEAGTVIDVRDLDASSTPEHKLFLAACRDVMMHWKYTPMTVVQENDDGAGNISQVERTAPFSLDYAFRFELVDGRPTVTAGRTPPGS